MSELCAGIYQSFFFWPEMYLYPKLLLFFFFLNSNCPVMILCRITVLLLTLSIISLLVVTPSQREQYKSKAEGPCPPHIQ